MDSEAERKKTRARRECRVKFKEMEYLLDLIKNKIGLSRRKNGQCSNKEVINACNVTNLCECLPASETCIG